MPSGRPTSAYSPRRRAPLSVLAILIVALAAAMAASVAAGPSGVHITVPQVVSVVIRHVVGNHAGANTPAPEVEAIVWEVRLPRALAAAGIGCLLAIAGVALQGLLMNPLADPYTVGVSAGAALGVAGSEVLGFAAAAAGFGAIGAGFAMAIVAVALVYTLAKVDGRVSAHTFLLAGVVVGTLLWSAIPLLMVLAGRGDDLQRIYFYLIGSLQGADWSRAALIMPFAAVSIGALCLWSRELNMMTLGEETALHLGVHVESFKRRALLMASLATAAAVSVGGIIGFVGLVVPHVARRIVGPDHRDLLPVAAVLGAILVLLSDTIARVWLSDMPVGVVTAVVGAPVFCYLLRRRQAVAW